MPGLQGENIVAALGSPIRRSKLSLKFLQKKETKRALDFSEPQADEPKLDNAAERPDAGGDQVVPCSSPFPPSPGLLLPSEKREHLVPFVGLNNLGNTCYLNSVLQVLYSCPGLREGVKKLYKLSKKRDSTKEESHKNTEQAEAVADAPPAQMELLGSFNSLVTSMEQLQSGFLLNPDSVGEDLATPPRKILNTLRLLNPMYEGFLQHDAQEVLQCILAYMQEACDTIRKEQDSRPADSSTEIEPEDGAQPESSGPATECNPVGEEENQVSGKRKSDTEVGNAKKKPKSAKSKKAEDPKEEMRSQPLTRSKRRSSSDVTKGKDGGGEAEDKEIKKLHKEEEEGGGDGEDKGKEASKEADGKSKKKARLRWLRPSGKQPSIFSKFRSVGKISCTTPKNPSKAEEEEEEKAEEEEENGLKTSEEKTGEERPPEKQAEDEKAAKLQDDLDLMTRLFQGQLVLRTRCLECESFTERREDFQDISVPVLDDTPSSPDSLSEVSPDPKPELKTLTWAIGQFASVERICGEDKYFCETCRHYAEAERSLLFDKTPEVITIHLKRFSANGLELDPYAGLSKVNTPLQTPLSLSLEEWCTRPAQGQHYQLFAVVMHSGVTIGSGHYTAFVRVSDVRDVKLAQERAEEDEEREEAAAAEEEEGGEGEGKAEKKTRDEAAEYDDGEVSFSLNPRKGAAGLGAKKKKKAGEGGVGLLGGQRNPSSCQLSSGSNKNISSEGTRRRKTINPLNPKTDAEGAHKEPEAAAAAAAATAAAEQQALDGLLRYQGKWLLFDDCEVRVFEEDDFQRACSPDTSQASTPYLLFYRRAPRDAP
ncbi:ubiquitin carboxyl-terminal hydrolase 1 isoform X2 [Nelusetta ayraudi]